MPEQIFESIERRLDDCGNSQQKLLVVIGMNRNTYTEKSRSYLKHIIVITEFLGVFPGYLFRGIEDEP